jgi:hypothetical protein
VRCKDDALNSTLGGAAAAYALVGIHRECRAESPTSSHHIAVSGLLGATNNENSNERLPVCLLLWQGSLAADGSPE